MRWGAANRVRRLLLVARLALMWTHVIIAGSCVQVSTTSCGCTARSSAQAVDQTDLLIIIGVPSALMVLLMLALVGFYAGREKDVTMKHKDQ